MGMRIWALICRMDPRLVLNVCSPYWLHDDARRLAGHADYTYKEAQGLLTRQRPLVGYEMSPGD